MNIIQLKYFLAIVKNGSFSKAADEMFLSQSSMSKQIKALETELGVELFKREHSKVFLTDIGYKFVQYAELTIKQYQDMLLTLEEFTVKKSNTIKFGSIPVISSYGVSAQIAKFTTKYKQDINVIIDMHENNQSIIMKELIEGSIDIALVRTDYLENLEIFDCIPYKLDHFALICNNEHPLRHCGRVTLEEIAQYPLSLLDVSSVIYTIVMKEFERLNINKKPKCLTTRHDILMEILQTTPNVSLLPESLLDLGNFPNLCIVNLHDELVSHVALVKLKKRTLNKITKDFWNYWKKNCTLE